LRVHPPWAWAKPPPALLMKSYPPAEVLVAPLELMMAVFLARLEVTEGLLAALAALRAGLAGHWFGRKWGSRAQ
jgi:hypothetical protein